MKKSATKAYLISLRNKKRNLEVENKIKELKKRVKEKDEKAFKEIIPLLDKAASKGIIHKNKASRLKSKLSKLIKKSTKKESK